MLKSGPRVNTLGLSVCGYRVCGSQIRGPGGPACTTGSAAAKEASGSLLWCAGRGRGHTTSGAAVHRREHSPMSGRSGNFCGMSSVSEFATYISHKRFCDRLEQAARRRPTFGVDPIHNFIEAASTGSLIEWRKCEAVADRLEELSRDWPAMGELARPAQTLAQRLRSAAVSETSFCMR